MDVESDDQSPAIGSMVCFGAVLISDTSKTLNGKGNLGRQSMIIIL